MPRHCSVVFFVRIFLISPEIKREKVASDELNGQTRRTWNWKSFSPEHLRNYHNNGSCRGRFILLILIPRAASGKMNYKTTPIESIALTLTDPTLIGWSQFASEWNIDWGQSERRRNFWRRKLFSSPSIDSQNLISFHARQPQGEAFSGGFQELPPSELSAPLAEERGGGALIVLKIKILSTYPVMCY